MDVREKLSTEKRLIEYSFVVAQIEKLRMDAWRDKAQSEAYRKVEDILTNAPTVYAVEVVRCRECKKKNKKKCPMVIVNFGRNGKEILVQNHVPDDFYCAAGERKEGAE